MAGRRRDQPQSDLSVTPGFRRVKPSLLLPPRRTLASFEKDWSITGSRSRGLSRCHEYYRDRRRRRTLEQTCVGSGSRLIKSVSRPFDRRPMTITKKQRRYARLSSLMHRRRSDAGCARCCCPGTSRLPSFCTKGTFTSRISGCARFYEAFSPQAGRCVRRYFRPSCT